MAKVSLEGTVEGWKAQIEAAYRNAAQRRRGQCFFDYSGPADFSLTVWWESQLTNLRSPMRRQHGFLSTIAVAVMEELHAEEKEATGVAVRASHSTSPVLHFDWHTEKTASLPCGLLLFSCLPIAISWSYCCDAGIL